MRVRGTGLAAGIIALTRAWFIVIPLIVVNAIAQGVLAQLMNFQLASFASIAATVLSALVLVTLLGILLAALLQSVNVGVTWAGAFHAFRAHWFRFTAWALGYLVATSLGFALAVFPGYLLIALLPYILIAVQAGDTHPWQANWRTIAMHPVRWAVVLLLVFIFGTLTYFLLGVMQFFLRGVVGSTAVWLVVGALTSWVLASFTATFSSIHTTEPAAQK